MYMEESADGCQGPSKVGGAAVAKGIGWDGNSSTTLCGGKLGTAAAVNGKPEDKE